MECCVLEVGGLELARELEGGFESVVVGVDKVVVAGRLSWLMGRSF